MSGAPLDAALVERIALEFGTPVYLYDARVIRAQLARLARFDAVRYAQKACSNLHLLRLMREAGAVVDAISLGEIERALRAGYTGQGDPAGIVYAADLLEPATLERIVECDIAVNAGSEEMLVELGRRRRGHRVWLRINPGFGHGHSRKTNTGGEWSKHGIWHAQLPEALKLVDEHGLELVGLHMHIGSGSDFENLRRVADAMVEQVERLGGDVQWLSTGGGLPVPYRPDEPAYDTDAHFAIWDAARRKVERSVGHRVRLEIEPGRFVVAQAGVLVAEVRATKRMGANRFVLVDAGFNNLVRPAMYGSYHRVSLVRRGGRAAEGGASPAVVAGPLCESGDVFTQGEGGIVTPVELPPARPGDWLVIHDAGAYGASQASNYNTRPLAPEVLVDGDAVRQIRRRQPLSDLLDLEEVE